MNDLSWLIYFAGIAGSVKTFFVVIGALGLLSSAVVSMFVLLELNLESYRKEKPPFPRILIWAGVVSSLLILVSTIIPSKQTIYMIAASEVGEQVIETPIAKKSFKLLEQYIDEQLSDDKPEQQAE